MKSEKEAADLTKLSPNRQGSTAGIAAYSLKTLLWLVAVFVLAIILPEPGNVLRSLSIPSLVVETPITLPHLVLGCLLFCAGLTVETARMPHVSLRLMPLAVLATWGTPFLVTGAICCVAKQLGVPDPVLLGLIVAAAMPVANASVGWTHLASGNLPLILSLLLGATVTAPVVAPAIVQTLAQCCLSADIHAEAVLPLKELARFLGCWVVLPAMFGLLLGLWSRSWGVVWSTPWLRRVSITSLLLLNYMNASSALPLIQSQQIVLQGLLCTVISIGGLMLVTWQVSRWLHVPWSDCVSLSLACGMRNTGAALVLAGTQFHQDPAVAMTILLQTLVQNVMAGVLISLATRSCPAGDQTEVIPAGK